MDVHLKHVKKNLVEEKKNLFLFLKGHIMCFRIDNLPG
jgi:hypothetical protein